MLVFIALLFCQVERQCN